MQPNSISGAHAPYWRMYECCVTILTYSQQFQSQWRHLALRPRNTLNAWVFRFDWKMHEKYKLYIFVAVLSAAA